MQTHTNSLQHALSQYTAEGRYSFGTAAIVESLHKDYKLSYEQLAKIAGVSIAGLTRWRNLDKGEQKTFAQLLDYAEKLAAGESGHAGNTAPSPTVTHANPARLEPSTENVRQAVPLTIAEAKLGLSLKFGVDPSMIDIVIKG